MNNPKFNDLIIAGAKRWIHGIDLRLHSNTYGIADREFWAWKTKDFANGTQQAGIAGFLNARHLLSLTDEEVQKIVNSILKGTRTIQRSNGSFEEAYPYESSYAVTGLVLFNFAYAAIKFPGFFKQKEKVLNDILKDAYTFLVRTDEKHGLISNHICSTVLGLQLYEFYSSGRKTLNKGVKDLLKLQHSEGWFPEYGLSDPGYQTLLNHYVTAFQEVHPDPEVELALQNSLNYVKHFAYPDGTFSGEIGSRGTRIVYPSGLHSSEWFELTLNHYDSVNPITIDPGNFVPVWNSWAQALSLKHNQPIPKEFEIHFKAANLFVAKTSETHFVLNLKNGCFINKRLEDNIWVDNSGVNFTDGIFHSQLGEIENLTMSEETIKFDLTGRKKNQMQNSLFKSLVIRIVGFIIYAFPFLQNPWKKLLATVVMGNSGQSTQLGCQLEIDRKTYSVTTKLQKSLTRESAGFYPHMASANTFSKAGL